MDRKVEYKGYTFHGIAGSSDKWMFGVKEEDLGKPLAVVYHIPIEVLKEEKEEIKVSFFSKLFGKRS